MDLDVPADADYVFDLISPDPERRRLALARDAALAEDFREALAGYDELWGMAKWSPGDPGLQAAMDQTRAAMSAAADRTLHGIALLFIRAYSEGGPADHDRLAPYAVLFLRWENAYPEQWRIPRASGSPWGLKKYVLRRFIQAGVPAAVKDDVLQLLIQAVAREHRCEDRGFAELARVLDGPCLRVALQQAETNTDPLVRLRAQYVRWVVEHPGEPVTTAGWRRWLASDDEAGTGADNVAAFGTGNGERPEPPSPGRTPPHC